MKRLSLLFAVVAPLMLFAQEEANSADFIARIRGEIDVCRKEAAAVRQTTENAWENHAARMDTLNKESDNLLKQLEQLKDEIDDLQHENAVAAKQNAAAQAQERRFAAMLSGASSTSTLSEKTESFLASKQSELESMLQPPKLKPMTAKDSFGATRDGVAVTYGPLGLFFLGDHGGQLFKANDGALPEVRHLALCLNAFAPPKREVQFPLDVTGRHPELLDELLFIEKLWMELRLNTTGQPPVFLTKLSTLVKHLRQGGILMIPIIALGIVCIIVLFIKLIGLMFHRPAADLLALDNAAQDSPSTGEALENMLFQLAQQRLAKHSHLLFVLSVSASAAPLLGLLGTVTGMIHTFRLITFFGIGDARLLADGISEALITTEAGLCIAIPALLCHAWLSRRIRHISTALEARIVTLCNNASCDKPLENTQGQP